jgi:hypothetical protein
VAERLDPKFAQVVISQGRQQVRIDVILAESLLVLIKAQFVQPCRDAHRAPMIGPHVPARMAVYNIFWKAGGRLPQVAVGEAVQLLLALSVL